jgi:hypothetical protein
VATTCQKTPDGGFELGLELSPRFPLPLRAPAQRRSRPVGPFMPCQTQLPAPSGVRWHRRRVRPKPAFPLSIWCCGAALRKQTFEIPWTSAAVLVLCAPACAKAVGWSGIFGGGWSGLAADPDASTDLFKQTRCLDKCRPIPSNDASALYSKDLRV